jgi:hypothetical protein
MKNRHPFWTKLDWRGARPLTLRELIMKSNFGAMMDIIIDFDPKMSNPYPRFTPSQRFCRFRNRF